MGRHCLFNSTEVCECWNETEDHEPIAERYERTLHNMEIVNLAFMGVTSWVFLCLVVYGTKTRRWTRRPGTSRLSNGAAYIACVVATGLIIAKLGLTEVLYRYRDLGNDNSFCLVMVRVMAGGIFFALYGVYVFLWILQRRIYTHPYVKERVNKYMERFSRGFLLLLPLGMAISYLSYYHAGWAPYWTGYGCAQSTLGHFVTLAVVLMVLTVILIQFTMVFLFVYPAYRIRFSSTDATELNDDTKRQPSVTDEQQTSRFQRFVNEFSKVSVSPIDTVVKRAVVSSVVIVVTDVLTMVIYIFVIDTCDPVVLHTAVTDISSVVNVFCMLGTFGFGFQVLTVCCPVCPAVGRGKRKNRSVENHDGDPE